MDPSTAPSRSSSAPSPQTPSIESPLQLPLVRQMLCDPTVSIRVRQNDARWRDENRISLVLAGFNPFAGEVYVPGRSGVASWLADPTASARDFNLGDRFILDLLFAVHDYLHVWSTRLIDVLAPSIGFGGPIGRDNFDDYVFAQLVSEAAATVGLDYWYLATVELDEVLPIGSLVRGGLTTPYHERDLAEYRRFHPALEVQTPRFFEALCDFYCSGVFVGFDAGDIVRSPRLMEWMKKEVGYGEQQRIIARRWFAYLSSDPIELTEAELAAPIDTTAPARRALVTAVGEALWAKVKERDVRPIPPRGLTPPTSPPDRIDFRYRTLDSVDPERVAAHPYGDDFQALSIQTVTRLDFELAQPLIGRHLRTIAEKRDPQLLAALTRGLPRLGAEPDLPRDLLFVG